jgi:hypothetical protein
VPGDKVGGRRSGRRGEAANIGMHPTRWQAVAAAHRLLPTSGDTMLLSGLSAPTAITASRFA